MSASEPTSRRYLIAASIAILLAAIGLRVYRLPSLPLGLHYDEAANGILANEIATGSQYPVFISSYTGKEVLFFYWAGLWMRLLGATPFALRLSAALAGIATVTATIWAVRELLAGRREATPVALLTAAFLATSFWHVLLSRYGFRAVTQPLMQALTVAALWRGLRGRTAWIAIAGCWCGLTAYTYLAARAFPIPLAAAMLALLLADRSRRRARLGQLALFGATASLTLAPLAVYWITHPGSFFTRAQQVAAASWADAWAGFRACLGMLFVRGDPYIRFNLPLRPILDPLVAGLLLLGLALVISTRRTGPKKPSSHPLLLASQVLLLTSLPIMLLPSALATGEITPSNLRAAGLLPFLYVFPAFGLWTLLGQVAGRLPASARRWLAPAACTVLFVFLLLNTTSAYFGDWAISPALYYAADGDVADVASYLNQSEPLDAPPYVASLHYRHPTMAFLSREYAQIRWLTGGSTLVFPSSGRALALFPRSGADDLAWITTTLPDEALVAAADGPDGSPAFHVFQMDAAWPGEQAVPEHDLSANMENAVRVVGYDVIGEPRSGRTAEVVIWYQVLNQPPLGDYGPVARLADRWGFIWGEDAPFHYPSEQWTAGEIVVDHLTVVVSPGTPPGDYVIRYSLYSPSAGRVIPVLDDAGRYAGTYVTLPIHLEPANAPPDVADLDICTPIDITADGLTLLGYNLDTPAARPGERLYVTLFWQGTLSPLADCAITLTLGDTLLYSGAPVHGSYPFSDWQPGELIADRYDPRLPRDLAPGDHTLRLSGCGLSADLDTITVQATDRLFEVPPISQPLSATLGSQVQLLGYDLSTDTAAPGETVILTLTWQALDEMDESYTVFSQILAPDGSMTGQKDNPPVGGSYPTELWLAGEVVIDSYEIPISATAAPGEHRLQVGMYIAESGFRLPVSGTSDDAILLQIITITE